MLRGVVKRPGSMIMLLDPAQLAMVEGQAAERRSRAAGLPGGGFAAEPTGRGGADAGGAADEIQLVSFEAAGQEYAFPIDEVQEIVQVPGRISHVPRRSRMSWGS